MRERARSVRGINRRLERCPEKAAVFGELISKVLKRMEPTSGLEPLTCRLRIGCSTN
jgi:hypothetical protein